MIIKIYKELCVEPNNQPLAGQTNEPQPQPIPGGIVMPTSSEVTPPSASSSTDAIVSPAEPQPIPVSRDVLASITTADDTNDESPAVEGQLVDSVRPLEGETDIEPVFTWQASEYVHHSKGITWYIVLVIVSVILTVGLVYFTHQWLSIGVIGAATVAIIVFAMRPPRTLSYEISHAGIKIDTHLYPFSHFRTFAVIPDIAWHTIDLEPTQRFMPRLNILFEDANFDTIIDHLSEYLPRADRKPDFVERATRYLRF